MVSFGEDYFQFLLLKLDLLIQLISMLKINNVLNVSLRMNVKPKCMKVCPKFPNIT